ncbi:MAG TPA: phage protease [Candidatus Binataceae bacterium]|nr:phage protease [Candidatus Binataceae bacterium]
MNELSNTRAGGDSGANPRKFQGFPRVDTAGAPAFGVETDSAAPPQWIQLIPAGSFHGRDGRGPYLLSDPIAVIAATMALKMRAGIPIDYDHATDFAATDGRPAPAAGWITEFAVRSGAIWGRVEWTDRASSAIRAHEYRYISPVFQYSPSDGTITRLLRAGLTNNPNLYLTAISAAGDGEETMDEFLKQLREMLGLSSDASLDEILAALNPILEGRADASGDADASHRAGSPDLARYVAVADFQKALIELNSLKMERSREKAEHAVDEAIRSGKLVPAHREWAITYCAADPRGFESFTARQPALLAGEMHLSGDPRALRSRAHAGLMLSATEVAICGLLGVTPNDFLKRKDSGADFLRLNKEHADPNL